MLQFNKENKKNKQSLVKLAPGLFELSPKTNRYSVKQFLVFNIPVGSFAVVVVVVEVDAELAMDFHCCRCYRHLRYYY